MNRFLVSNYQMALLNEAAKKGIGLQRMFDFRQGTAGSIFRRGFLKYNEASERFLPTEECLKLLEAYRSSDVTRKDTTRPLSKYIMGRNINRKSKGSGV